MRTSSMPDIRSTQVYVGRSGTRTANCCFPSLCQLPHDALLVSWRIGSRKDSADSTVCFANSYDGGITWSEPIKPFDRTMPGRIGTFELDHCPGSLHMATLTALPDGRALAAMMWLDRSAPDRPMFNDKTEGLVRVETLLTESSDGGRTWSEPRLLDAAPFAGRASLCAPMLLLPDGRIAAQLETNKPYDDADPWRQMSILKFSDDRGLIWPEYAVVAQDPTTRIRYWDQRHAVMPDGHLIACLWTYDSIIKRDLPFHTTISHDGGRTWSQPRDSGLLYQIAYPVALSDGRLAVLAIDRFGTRSIRLLLSEDDGMTFNHPGWLVYEQSGGRVEPGAEDHHLSDQQLWTFGRVEAIASPEGAVLAVYYAGDSEATAIQFVKITDIPTYRTVYPTHAAAQNCLVPQQDGIYMFNSPASGK